ncbi:ABC transporter permease [Fimbriiglobus ruber]|uniref:Spermidine Putrescine ABC transporter permease component PotB n=1 Tax=Fimbriiglobus ruber TaxID=1908690 RepID=A0A225DYX8_9BACT|nr:ABC transporter permease [Fimbriiglobus ruber]OWK46730.1 Spermidine Putrescine ABC transporter permease component PotB [Fimbriiglobus ruber]
MTPRPFRPIVPWLLAAPAVVLLLGFFLGPVLLLFRVSVYESGSGTGFYRPGTWSLQAYAGLIEDGYGRGVLAFTVFLGVAVATLSVLVGYPLALFIHTLRPLAKRLALAAVILPKLANVFVVLYGVSLLLGNSGPLNQGLLWLGLTREPILLSHSLAGVLIAETYLIMPYAVLILVPAFDRIDPILLAAARGLGAGSWTTFRRVTLPLSLPGVAVAGQLCLIWALGAFVGPLLLGGPEQTTLAVLVPRYGLEYGDWPTAAVTSVLSLLTIAVCVTAFAWPARRLGRLGQTR